jgi:hypothetical protein
MLRERRTASPWAVFLAIVTSAACFAWQEETTSAQGTKNDGKKQPMPHVFSGPAPAHPLDVILCRPTDTSITVSVLAYQDAEAYLEFGPANQPIAKTEVRALQAKVPVEFVLANLKPNAPCSYRVLVRQKGQPSFEPDAERRFHTARPPGSSFVFTMQADSHLDQNTRPEVYERSLAQALKDKTDFHIDLGDTFMTDKYGKGNHKASLPQYFAQRYYLSQLGHSAAIFMVLGNHDGERLDDYDGSPECMSVWSCMMRKSLFPNPRPGGFYSGNTTEKKPLGVIENYYAWEWGDALFVALDPFWSTEERMARKSSDGNWKRTLGKEQYDWLAKTLEASKSKYKFLFIHHLVGGLDESARGGSEAAALYEWGGKSKDGKDEFAKYRPNWSMPIHDLLLKHKVSAVFHGHDHFFARQERDDIVYQLVPQPGHPGFANLRNAEEYGYLRGHFLPPTGILRVTVAPEKATVDYVRSYQARDETATRRSGEVSMSYTIRPRK